MLFESQRLLRGAPRVKPNERDNLSGKRRWCELVQTQLCIQPECYWQTALPSCGTSERTDHSMCGRTTACLTGWGRNLGGIKGHSSLLYFFSYLFPFQTWIFPCSKIPRVQGQKRQLNPMARPCACARHRTALADPSSPSASRLLQAVTTRFTNVSNYEPVNQCEKQTVPPIAFLSKIPTAAKWSLSLKQNERSAILSSIRSRFLRWVSHISLGLGHNLDQK